MSFPEPWPSSLQTLLDWTSPRPSDAVPRAVRVPALFAETLQTPQPFPLVKVTGTNGKGSTCALLESCLIAAGHTPGVFTSPHLVRVRERFRIAGVEVSGSDLNRCASHILERLQAFVLSRGEKWKPAFFEGLILIALELFRERGVTVAVFEAGIGGASDAVAWLPGVVSALTSVGFDHMRELGYTLEAIAIDKAGVADPGTTLVLGPRIRGNVRTVIQAVCTARGVSLVETRLDDLTILDTGWHGSTLRVAGSPGSLLAREVVLNLLGAHQHENLLVAVGVLQQLAALGILHGTTWWQGTGKASWPARLEPLGVAPRWLLDVAHNAHGFAALATSLEDLVPREQRVLLYGAAAEKDFAACCALVSHLAPVVYLVEGFHRAASVGRLLAAMPKDVSLGGTFATPEEAVSSLSRKYRDDRTILVAGSVFLAGAVREALSPESYLP